jgi:hypothetical protein
MKPGRNEVYITPFPASANGLPVSTAGGTQAVWNRMAKEFSIGATDKMMAVERDDAARAEAVGTEDVVRRAVRLWRGRHHSQFDVSRDGRFVMVKPESGAGRLNVVLNWFANRSKEP